MFDDINKEISALEELCKKVQPLDVKFQRLQRYSILTECF